MKLIKELRWFRLGLLGLIATLLCVCCWVNAQEPFSAFPDFISFTGNLAVNKTGDVAFDKTGNVYVNVTANGRVEVWEFSPAGEYLSSTDICAGVAYGLAISANGDIYAAVTGAEQGVYKVDRYGNVILLPGTNQIAAANALAFDKQGKLYVTESFSITPEGDYGQGGIWRIPQDGEAELMMRNDLLTGDNSLPQPYPIGANGIACYHGDLYVVNCEKGLILQIPIESDGDLGQPEIWKELEDIPESPLYEYPYLPIAGDGIAFDVFGNLYVAVVTRLAVVKIDAENLSQETVAVLNPASPLHAPLDTPNSLAFGTGKGSREDLVVTNLGTIVLIGPCLVRVETDVPGLPLP